ncbi:MAG: ATP synthase F0 subunit C [Thermodesulfobacteriota bacterium]|nr:ATP synthase F0 subunit C [Thermodesulfobacteriota bacterium]
MFDATVFSSASFFIGAGLAIGFGAIGAALGEGYTAGIASESLSYRPESSGDVVKNMLVGQAIAESAAIFALVVAIVLLFSQPSSISFLTCWAAIGAGLSMGLSAIGSGVGSGLPAGAACMSIVRL